MKSNYDCLGNYIRLIDTRNKDYVTNKVMGINIDKFFMPSVANVIGTDLSKYKLITKGKFACNPMHVGRDERLPVALYEEDEPALVSPAYFMFEIIDNNVLDENYLMMWFRRAEFDRICWLHTDGSVRGGITWDDICRMELPVPDIGEQRKIVEAYKIVEDRIELKRKIIDNLTEQCSVDYSLMLKGFTTESEELPDGWSKGSIGNYCDVKSGFAFKSDWWTNSGNKVIKIANIVNNTIDLDSCDCVIPEHAQKANNFYVNSGDILIAMTGATTGKIGIVPMSNEPIVVNQRVGKFFLGDNPIEKAPFLYSTLLYSRVVCHLQPDGTAGSAQDNLSADNIKDVAIVLPDQSIIDTFNGLHIHHLKMMINIWAEIRSLNKMAKIVLQTLSSS